MFRKRRKRSDGDARRRDAGTEAMLAAVEEMLTGRLVLGQSWRERDAWTCVNALGHADWDTLRAFAAEGPRRPAQPWDTVLAFLAAELLSTAKEPSRLEQVQRRELIPLELELLAGDVPATVSPARLAEVVQARLAHTRGSHPGGGGPPAPG
ncbi:MAG TPA: hypothetical protein VMU14_01935 [Acidimicrobiales bacterium]|nr:hypothetical protein [Acidimicrobiales bacterium]